MIDAVLLPSSRVREFAPAWEYDTSESEESAAPGESDESGESGESGESDESGESGESDELESSGAMSPRDSWVDGDSSDDDAYDRQHRGATLIKDTMKDLRRMTGQEGKEVSSPRPCVCAYDFDATLTSAPGCPGAVRSNHKNYFLSEAARMLRHSPCGSCYSAILSAGGERPALKMLDLPRSDEIEPILLWNLDPDRKGDALGAVVSHFRDRGVNIETRDVHFFDDNPRVVEAFSSILPEAASNQVSCPSSSDPRGKCGAKFTDIVLGPAGLRKCDDYRLLGG